MALGKKPYDAGPNLLGISLRALRASMVAAAVLRTFGAPPALGMPSLLTNSPASVPRGSEHSPR